MNFSQVLGGELIKIRHFDLWNGGVIPSTDVAGITYNPDTNTLFISDSEINEFGYWNNKNIFETNLMGNSLLHSYVTVSDDLEPTGICYNSNNNTYYITNDNTYSLYAYKIISGSFTKTGEWYLKNSPFNMDDPEGVTVNLSNNHLYIR